MIQEEFNRVVAPFQVRLRLASTSLRRFPQAEGKKLHHNALHWDGHFLICMKHIGVISPYYTHSEHTCADGPPLKMWWAVCEWQGQDKRRRTDCNKNSIICSQSDIILPFGASERRGVCVCGGGLSKTAFRRLSTWMWLTTVARQEILLKFQVNYNVPALDVFI